MPVFGARGCRPLMPRRGGAEIGGRRLESLARRGRMRPGAACRALAAGGATLGAASRRPGGGRPRRPAAGASARPPGSSGQAPPTTGAGGDGRATSFAFGGKPARRQRRRERAARVGQREERLDAVAVERPSGRLPTSLVELGERRGVRGRRGVGSRPAIALRSRATCLSVCARHLERRRASASTSSPPKSFSRRRQEGPRFGDGVAAGFAARRCVAAEGAVAEAAPPGRIALAAAAAGAAARGSSGRRRRGRRSRGPGGALTCRERRCLARRHASSWGPRRRRSAPAREPPRSRGLGRLGDRSPRQRRAVRGRRRPRRCGRRRACTRFTSRARRASARRPAARLTGMSAASSSSTSAGRPLPGFRFAAAVSAGVPEPLASRSFARSRADARLGVARDGVLLRPDERDGAFLADEDGLRIDVAAAGVGAVGDLERQVAGELRRERDALRLDDGEDVLERDRASRASSRRSGSRSSASGRRRARGTPSRRRS